MPRQKTEEGLTKHTLNLFPGDYERANSLYENMSAAEVIRKVLRKFLNEVEGKPRLPKKDLGISI